MAGSVNPISFLTQMVRIAVPYLFAASGGVVAERAGIVSLTLEGFMLTGAFAAGVGNNYTGSPRGGGLAGMVGGLIFLAVPRVSRLRDLPAHHLGRLVLRLLATRRHT